MLYFVDLVSFTFIGSISLPKNDKSYWLEHPADTDLFISRNLTTSGNQRVNTFTVHQLTANDPRFCHKTCQINWKYGDKIDYKNKHRYCPRDFTPCSLVGTLFFIGLSVAGAIMLIFIVARVICIYRSKRVPGDEEAYVQDEALNENDSSIHVDVEEDNEEEVKQNNMDRVF